MPDPLKPTTEGTFLKTPFANVLLYAREKKMNGSIVVTIEPADPVMREQIDVAGKSTLVLEEGRVVAVSLPRTVDTLAWVLRDMELINDAVFAQVQEAMQKPGTDEVSTLMRLRACSPMTLDKALREQTRRKVLALFNFDEGSYAYYARADLLNGAERVRTPEDILPIVWRAFSLSPPDAATIDPVLARIGNRAVRLREGHEFDRFEFGSEVGLAATQLKVAPSAIDQLVGLGTEPAVVRAMVYLLALTRQLEVVSLGAAAAPAAPPAPAPKPPTRTSAPPFAAASEEPEELDELEMEAVPDAPLPPPPAPRAPTPVPTPAAAAASTPAGDEAKLAAAQKHLRDLDHKTYFEMFELTFTASHGDISAAFPKAAAPWHPDKVSSLALKAVYTEIFAHYNIAHATLTDPKSREQYEGSLSGGGGTPAAQKAVAAVLDTVQDMHRAEMSYKRKDFAEADKLLRRVIAASPDDIPAQLMLAQVLFEMDVNNVEEAMTLTANVIKNSERNDKAFSLMGAMLKHKGDRRYVAFYREALGVNPNNVDASREVRLYERRALEKREQNTTAGKISRFFGNLVKPKKDN